MRPGRVVVLASLPLLGGLGLLPRPPAQVADAAPLPPAAAVRLVTDGHPRPVALAARPPVAAPAARAARPVVPAAVRHPRVTRAPRPRVAAVLPTTDRYPWAADTTGGSDPWGFTKRQCVSYVAWRLAGAGRPLDTQQGWGSALSWDEVARRLGDPVTTTPRVGSVAQWNPGESSPWWSGAGVGSFTAGSYGHVAVVTQVLADGSVVVAQYNGTRDRAFSTMRVRAPRYLLL